MLKFYSSTKSSYRAGQDRQNQLLMDSGTQSKPYKTREPDIEDILKNPQNENY